MTLSMPRASPGLQAGDSAAFIVVWRDRPQRSEAPPECTSQTCRKCGAINKASRTSQSEFACVECGYAENADVTAACNVLRLGHSRWACGSNRNSGRKQELSMEAIHVAA